MNPIRRLLPLVFISVLGLSFFQTRWAQPVKAQSRSLSNSVSTTRAVSGFTASPWEMTLGGGGRAVPLPPHDSSEFLYENQMKWALPPDAHWTPAPNPRTLDFFQQTGIPVEEKARFFYFRTTLNLSPSAPRNIRLSFDHIDDGLVVYVNGRLAWHNRTSSFGVPQTQVPLSRYLQPGPNRIVLVLADWCTLAELRGAKFMTEPGPSQQAAASHRMEDRNSPPESSNPTPTTPEMSLHPTVTLRPKTPPLPVIQEAGGSDDWLRPRRDDANSSHSNTPLHLPLKEAWSVPYNIVDARVWGDTVLGLSKTNENQNPQAPDGSIQQPIVAEAQGTLYALDLKTGRERWHYPGVTALGDASEDGRIAIITTLEADKDDAGAETIRRRLTVLDARNGEEQWHREGTNWMAPLAVHQGILYLFDGKDQLLRFSLADGSVIPTTTAPLEGWSLPAFTDNQIVFGSCRWLYALYLPDPQRGTKFYDGGITALVYRDRIVSEGGAHGWRGFLREGKWLRIQWLGPFTGAASHAWIPLGENGAVLENGNCLRDISTGEVIWDRNDEIRNDNPYYQEGELLPNPYPDGTTYGPYDGPDVRDSDLARQEYRWLASSAPFALSAGTQIIQKEARPETEEHVGNETLVVRGALTVRNARNGDLLWESRERGGRPLAVTGGRLLVASHYVLHCLQ
jgi:outer membrane protein assembly factor BamB